MSGGPVLLGPTLDPSLIMPYLNDIMTCDAVINWRKCTLFKSNTNIIFDKAGYTLCVLEANIRVLTTCFWNKYYRECTCGEWCNRSRCPKYCHLVFKRNYVHIVQRFCYFCYLICFKMASNGLDINTLDDVEAAC
jgi:hypothetical protein